MQMTIRSRIIDVLPFLVALVVVAVLATAIVVVRVVREPAAVPPPQVAQSHELPRSPAQLTRAGS